MIYNNWDMKVFLIWSLVAVGQVVNFYFNHVTYFAYLERIRHHAVLGLIPLSAFGIYILIDKVLSFFKERKDMIAPVLCIGIVIFAFYSGFTYVDKGEYIIGNKELINEIKIKSVITEKDYEAMLFLKDITDKNMILSEPRIANVIYPITRNYVFVSSNIFHTSQEHFLPFVYDFFETNLCEKKEKFTNGYGSGIDYIYTKKPMNCETYKLIYSENFRYIYEVVR